MESEPAALAPAVGAATSVLLALVVFAPLLLVTGQGDALGAYYASGPVGVAGVGFIAVLATVVFLAGYRDRTDPDIAAGITLVLGLAAVALSLLWSLAIDPTVLFSFPSEYAWLEIHRWLVVAGSVVVAAAAGLYARAVL